MMEVLRNNRQIEDDESVNKAAEIISNEKPKTGNIASCLDSISDVVKS